MAVIYSFTDAVRIIAEGKDIDAIIDITKRFPNLAIVTAKACAGNPQFVIELAKAVPDYVTARKAENAYKAISGREDAEPDEAPEPKEKARQEAPEEAEETKAKKPSRKKQANAKKQAPKPERDAEEDVPFRVSESEEAADEESEEEVEEDLGKYAGKKASELYKELKSRGIKAKPRQNASVYAELLIEDDKKAEEADDAWDDDEDDWDI